MRPALSLSDITELFEHMLPERLKKRSISALDAGIVFKRPLSLYNKGKLFLYLAQNSSVLLPEVIRQINDSHSFAILSWLVGVGSCLWLNDKGDGCINRPKRSFSLSAIEECAEV